MLSYKHGFHAGNHADVLKHIVLFLLIEKLKQKDKPFSYIDTHSAAGIYDLTSDEANKTQEYQSGIVSLSESTIAEIPLIAPYLELVKSGLASQTYLGSPKLAQELLRSQDQLNLIELHNNEIRELKRNMRGDDRVSIHHRDGFEGLAAITPPKPARGLALIDPAYEVKDDYAQVVKAVSSSVAKWPVGIFAIWYPILAAERDRSEWLTRKLAELPVKNLLISEMCVSEQETEFGMHGSGMAIINAPYQLDKQLEQILPSLTQTMAQDAAAYHKLEWLVQPS